MKKTLLDEFAMAALSGFITINKWSSVLEVSVMSYAMANAMMEEKKRQDDYARYSPQSPDDSDIQK